MVFLCEISLFLLNMLIFKLNEFRVLAKQKENSFSIIRLKCSHFKMASYFANNEDWDECIKNEKYIYIKIKKKTNTRDRV